jgi:hypothetical protein
MNPWGCSETNRVLEQAHYSFLIAGTVGRAAKPETYVSYVQPFRAGAEPFDEVLEQPQVTLNNE